MGMLQEAIFTLQRLALELSIALASGLADLAEQLLLLKHYD